MVTTSFAIFAGLTLGVLFAGVVLGLRLLRRIAARLDEIAAAKKDSGSRRP